jgi:uncharacterized membrane protein
MGAAAIRSEATRLDMYAKARLDPLTDGLFGFAMTLLVLDIRLPDHFQPRNQGELIAALLDLWPKFFPYMISFFVLGSRWLSNAISLVYTHFAILALTLNLLTPVQFHWRRRKER